MTDTRTKGRYAINFRVVYDDIKLKNNNCGFQNNNDIVYSNII